MLTVAKIDVEDHDPSRSVVALLHQVLALDDIAAILVPLRFPGSSQVMPTLVSNPEVLDAAAPLSPLFPLNAAKLVSRLTRKPSGARIAAVLRPCEIRAFIELVKLKQGNLDHVITIGVDCPGAMEESLEGETGHKDQDNLKRFLRITEPEEQALKTEEKLMPACRACEHPVAEAADLSIGFLGVDIANELVIEANTPSGNGMITALNLPVTESPAERQQVIHDLTARRTAYRDRMFGETRAATDSIEKLGTYLAACINCYNCRVACPVCYCRECVFVTDVFDHEPVQYLQWANRRGGIKMPTDTLFYHLTRLAHMSTACVGCGQCSKACPNDIPLMELFRTIAHDTQQAFNYEAGRSTDERPPLSEFKEDEFQETVGIGGTG